MVHRHQKTTSRTILRDLTQEIKRHNINPFEAYALFCQRIDHYDTYCSSSITSGGHARNSDNTMAEIIQKIPFQLNYLSMNWYMLDNLILRAASKLLPLAIPVGRKVNIWSFGCW